MFYLNNIIPLRTALKSSLFKGLRVNYTRSDFVIVFNYFIISLSIFDIYLILISLTMILKEYS